MNPAEESASVERLPPGVLNKLQVLTDRLVAAERARDEFVARAQVPKSMVEFMHRRATRVE